MRAGLGEDNRRAVPQDDYPALMRIAGKLAELSPAELAEYRGRVTASTTGWEELEASVDRFIAERQAATRERERTVTQLYGMRELYRRYRLYLSMLTNTAVLAAPVGGMGGAGLGMALGSRPRTNRFRSELEADLAPYGGMAGFEALIRRYEKAYEQDPLAVARVMLDQYEHTLYEQGQCYQSATAGTELHRAVALTGERQHYGEAEREARTSMMYGGSVH
ncbi:hypothetical protein ACF09Y_26465 [Streptomyces massasporeus]|uniref:hypothetical protein n=1 Tax=Streptomyces massasporeus TaxID=67324 RepID=UPI0036FE524A